VKRVSWRRLATLLVGGLVTLTLVRHAGIHVVNDDQMAPRLQAGDLVLVDRLTYLVRAPYRGEIVETAPPGHAGLRRVVALGGDTLEIRGADPAHQELLLGSVRLAEPYRSPSRHQPAETRTHASALIRPATPQKTGLWHVPGGALFIVGDNRWESRDSRQTGPTALDSVRGRALFVLYPLERRGWLP